MAFFDKFADKQVIKLVKHYTGNDISPSFVAPCESDISPGWRGVVALDSQSIWLVNRLGARGVQIANIAPSESSGQYPPGTKGYPKYHFTFFFTNGAGSFTVLPISEENGFKMQSYLERFK